MATPSEFRVEAEQSGKESVFFRWAIYSLDDDSPIKKSIRLYPSRAEALLDGRNALLDLHVGKA
jgi:hypothetical protein